MELTLYITKNKVYEMLFVICISFYNASEGRDLLYYFISKYFSAGKI